MKFENFLRFAILLTGFSGFITQILLLRELLVVFSGNELSIGIIFMNWLIFEGIGSYIIGRINFKLNEYKNFTILTFLFGFYLPFGIYLIRISKNILKISISQMVGISYVAFLSLFILFIPSFIHGMLFTLSCKIYSKFSKERAIGYVYIYEIIGTILGGVIWTYLLISYFHSFQISLLITFISFFISLIVFLYMKNYGFLQKFFYFLLFVSVTFFVIKELPNRIHKISLTKQWKDLNVLVYQNSIYSNICLCKVEEQYIFFVNGLLHSIIPVADIYHVEEFVHLPMHLHPSPKNILIVGGNFEVINEILKYDMVKSVKFVELDPDIIKVIRNLPEELTKVFKNEKLKVIHKDGRKYLLETEEKYDLIFLGFSEPTNLQLNRYFTEEFFSIVKNRMDKNGIFVFELKGSLTYLNEEQKKLHKCIYETLNSVFKTIDLSKPKIRVFPGFGNFLYLASQNSEILWNEKILKKENVNLYLESKIHRGWFEFYKNLLDELEIDEINRDYKPIALFYAISYWNTVFTPKIKIFFNLIEKLKMGKIIILILIFSIFHIFFKKKTLIKNLSFSIFSTGFSGMVFNLITIFYFQICHGYLFFYIGFITSFFMLGSGTGAFISNELSKRNKNFKRFLFSEILLIIYSFSLPFLLLFFKTYPFMFLFFSFTGGLLTGFQFPIANVLCLKYEKNLGKVVGRLYASDLIGGCLGSILCSLVFIPILGIFNTCFVTFIFKLISFLKLFLSYLNEV